MCFYNFKFIYKQENKENKKHEKSNNNKIIILYLIIKGNKVCENLLIKWIKQTFIRKGKTKKINWALLIYTK